MRHALHAEWTKLRTTRGTIWLLLGLISSTVVLSAAAASSVTCSAEGCTQDTTKLSLTGVVLGQAIVAVLAVLVISSEYSTGMIHVTLTAMPRRNTVLAAKATVITAIVTAAGALGVIGSLLAGRLMLPGHLSLTDGSTVRAAVGSVLYLALIGLLSLGIATAVRDGAVAIGLVLGVLYLSPILVHLVTDPDWHRRLQQFGPMTAGLGIQATVDLDTLPLSPWAGLGVLAAWAATALLAGGTLLHRRDA